MTMLVGGKRLAAVLGIVSLSIMGCDAPRGGAAKMDAMPAKTLYERLGGEPALTAVVDDFVGRAARDPAVNFTRSGKFQLTPDNVAHLKKMLVQFIGSATGGPQHYEGHDMSTAHMGMRITESEFGAIANDLKATLAQFKVPEHEQSELMGIVGTTRDAIVAK